MIILEANDDIEARRQAWRGADVLVLAPTPTHPQDYGNRKRIFGVCSRLTELGARITYLHYPAEAEWRERIPAMTAMADAWHAFYTIPVGRPLHTSAQATDHMIDEWWDESIGVFLSWLFRLAQFDAFIVNYTWLSKAFEYAPPSVARILDTHDRFAGRRALLGTLDIAPEYFHTTEAEEAIALNRADIVWAIKEQEQHYFETLTSHPVLTLPHIDPINPLPAPPEDANGVLRVGIIGASNNINLRNLEEFLSVAVPFFERFFAPLSIHVAGSVCDRAPKVDERFVRLVGRIDDVVDFYRSVDLVCIPLRISTGLKIKTSEAISLGMPVVSLGHGFEGFFPCHPYHTLPSFAELADKLVEIAFDRTVLPRLREASLRAARLTGRAVTSTLEKTWQIVAHNRRAVCLCVSAAVLEVRAPGRCVLLSTLQFLTTLGDAVVVVVAGPIEPLLKTTCNLNTHARCFIARELVANELDAAVLRDRGYIVAPLEEIFHTSVQTLVVVDAVSEALLAVSPGDAMFVFRMEVIAQHGAADVRTPAIAAFLEDCRDPVVAVCRPSPTAGALAAGRASLLTAPCCWRSAEVRKQFGGARRSGRLLILVNERLDGFHVFAAFLVRLKFKPLVVFTPATMPETLEDGAGTPVEYLSAQTYLSLVAQGMEELPGLALDLSFGETGLQFLHEIFLRLGIPVVCGDDVIPQPSMTGGYRSGRVQSYEAMIAKVIAATRGLPVLDDRQRTALQDELDSDAGWAWLSQYSLLALG